MKHQISARRKFPQLFIIAVLVVSGFLGALSLSSNFASANSSSQGIDHVVLIMMENNWDGTIKGAPDAPYINSLISHYAFASDYYPVFAPTSHDSGSSLPNYIGITSGSLAGFSGDCNPNSQCETSDSNIFSLLQSNGFTWKEYAESMPSPCYKSDSGDLSTDGFVAHHDPIPYYTDLASLCSQNDVPLGNVNTKTGAFFTALENNSLPNFSFITPNSCDDMHNCPVASGDTWLSQFVPDIINSPEFSSTIIMITWDNGPTLSDPVPMIIVGPSNLVNYGQFSVHYTHYSTLATVEDIFGVGSLGREDSTATPMSAILNVKSPTMTTLSSPNPKNEASFGSSVAMSGNYALVGAPSEDASGLEGAGHAYLFSSNTGSLITELTSPNAQINGSFGQSVAISGTLALIGAPQESVGTSPFTGDAYVFNVTTGALISTLKSPDSQSNGFFGYSVALSGVFALVGAPDQSVSGYKQAGAAYLFNVLTGSLASTLNSPNLQNHGAFGYSVSLGANAALVGAPGEKVGSSASAGRAYLFNANAGTLVATLVSPNSQARGAFGSSVSTSRQMAIVGAPRENADQIARAGHAYSFNATSGALIYEFTSTNARANGNFGESTATDGSIVLVGAPGEGLKGASPTGKAYLFNATTGLLTSVINNPNVQAHVQFGYSVATSTGSVLVGCPGQSSGYLF